MTMETGHKSKPKKSNGGRPPGHLGFEATLWATAVKLRGGLDAAEYKHVVGLTPGSGLANARKFFNDSNGGVPEREERSPIHAH